MQHIAKILIRRTTMLASNICWKVHFICSVLFFSIHYSYKMYSSWSDLKTLNIIIIGAYRNTIYDCWLVLFVVFTTADYQLNENVV